VSKASARRPARAVEALRRGLVVSSQAPEGSPLREPRVLAAMAIAAADAGAAGLRLEGAATIDVVRRKIKIPIIGLVKRGSAGVYITPSFDDARRVVEAGAELVAIDATVRREGLAELVERIHRELHALVVADVATAAEGVRAAEAGADVISTTLAGYTTGEQPPATPDLRLVGRLARLLGARAPVMAEGRIATAAQVAAAFERGAWCVCVGTAITRPDVLTKVFLEGCPKK